MPFISLMAQKNKKTQRCQRVASEKAAISSENWIVGQHLANIRVKSSVNKWQNFIAAFQNCTACDCVGKMQNWIKLSVKMHWQIAHSVSGKKEHEI